MEVLPEFEVDKVGEVDAPIRLGLVVNAGFPPPFPDSLIGANIPVYVNWSA
jgi:hypothetical protein